MINTTNTSLMTPPKKERKPTVETTKAWREISRGERGHQDYFVTHTRYTCQLCGCCIGPGYKETEMYLWSAPPGKDIYLAQKNCYVTYKEWTWIKICGGCAVHHSRMLRAYRKVFFPECWETTLLIAGGDEQIRPVNFHDPQEVIQVVEAIDRHIKTAPKVMQSLLFFLPLLLQRPKPFSWPALMACYRLIEKDIIQERTERKRRTTIPVQQATPSSRKQEPQATSGTLLPPIDPFIAYLASLPEQPYHA